MNCRGTHGNYPISAPVDPQLQAMKPLKRGVSTALKPYLIAKRGKIKQNVEHNAQDGQPCFQPIPTWAELMHGIVNRS